jgi:hypothetical protein
MDGLLALLYISVKKGGAERLRIHEMGIGIGMGPEILCPEAQDPAPLYQRCSTRSLISWVRPWFQNWVPI